MMDSNFGILSDHHQCAHCSAEKTKAQSLLIRFCGLEANGLPTGLPCSWHLGSPENKEAIVLVKCCPTWLPDLKTPNKQTNKNKIQRKKERKKR